MDDNIKVSVSVKDQTIDNILNLALKGQNLNYSIKNKVIYIGANENSVQNNMQGAMQQKITGTVTHAGDNSPVIGATVVIEGTSTVALTDANGKFGIDVPNNDSILIVYVGYNAQRVNPKGQTTLEIKDVPPDVKNLEEVVVVGYGTVKRKI